jgi:hypothetical protein
MEYATRAMHRSDRRICSKRIRADWRVIEYRGETSKFILRIVDGKPILKSLRIDGPRTFSHTIQWREARRARNNRNNSRGTPTGKPRNRTSVSERRSCMSGASDLATWTITVCRHPNRQ